MEYWYDMGYNETMLNVQYPFGPGLTLNTTLPPYFGSFESFRVYEILHDSGGSFYLEEALASFRHL